MDENSLESTSSSSLDEASTFVESVSDDQPSPPSGSDPSHSSRKKLYIILGLVGIALVILIIMVTVQLVKKDPKKNPTAPPIVINTQSLDNGTLNKLTTATPTSKTQLTIAPDTLFKGDVHVQGAEQVDKNLEVNGTSTLQGAVSINSNLAVRGSLSVGGSLSAPSLNIGSLTTTAITVSGSISFGEHLIPTGAIPTVTAGRSALGGSVQISGNDTAGTVTISTGNGSALDGELATIHFHKAFATTPKVQLTPINAESAALRYYVARTAGFLTINTATPPTPGASYTFDYLVTQ